MLNKYRSANDQSFKTVSITLKELAESAHSILNRKGE
jgi:hypothetical protein